MHIQSVNSKKHDKKIADEEQTRLPEGSVILRDLGFKGADMGKGVTRLASWDIHFDEVYQWKHYFSWQMISSAQAPCYLYLMI